MDSLPALTLSFTEEHLQAHGSHTLRTLLNLFVGKGKGNAHIKSWMLMKDLTMCARRSMNTLSSTLALDHEVRKQLPEPSIASFFYFW